MNHRGWLTFPLGALISLAWILLCCRVQSWASDTQTQEVLDSVPFGTEKKVTYRAQRQTVEDLLRQLQLLVSDRTSMRFEVEGKHASRRITLAVREQPLKDVLAAIAKALNLEWRQTREAFRLYAPTISTSQAAAARELARILKEEVYDKEEVEFVSKLFNSSALKDADVDRLAAEFPVSVGKSIRELPTLRLAVRVFTWLNAEERAALLSNPDGIVVGPEFVRKTGGNLGLALEEIRFKVNRQKNYLEMAVSRRDFNVELVLPGIRWNVSQFMMGPR